MKGKRKTSSKEKQWGGWENSWRCGDSCWAAPPSQMSVLAWNCRGLGASPAIRTVTKVVKQKNSMVIFLVETKASIDRMKGFQNKLGFTQGIIVLSDGRSGGLALLWREGMDIHFKSCSHSHIDAVVNGEGNESPWRVIGFYGHPNTEKRYTSWQ